MRHVVTLIAALSFAAFTGPALAADNATPAPAMSAAPAAAATPAKTFSDTDKAQIEDIIKDYLTKEHPEVLMEAMQELQKRDQISATTKSEAAIKAATDKIFNDPDTPVGGNLKGDVTMVEFFDYQCGYCKMSEPDVEKLVKEDKNIKFIYKEFPILGPMSATASKAALASVRQGSDKYVKFHDALMAKKDHLSEDMIYETAKSTGLDVAKLKKDMDDEAIGKMVQANLELGSDIGVRGTPMFIIGDQIFPGAMQYDQMKKAVTDTRTAKKQ